jgi:hypothetical protein
LHHDDVEHQELIRVSKAVERLFMPVPGRLREAVAQADRAQGLEGGLDGHEGGPGCAVIHEQHDVEVRPRVEPAEGGGAPFPHCQETIVGFEGMAERHKDGVPVETRRAARCREVGIHAPQSAAFPAAWQVPGRPVGRAEPLRYSGRPKFFDR